MKKSSSKADPVLAIEDEINLAYMTRLGLSPRKSKIQDDPFTPSDSKSLKSLRGKSRDQILQIYSTKGTKKSPGRESAAISPKVGIKGTTRNADL